MRNSNSEGLTPERWLRIKAAEALAAIGEPAKPVVPQILKMLAREPGPEDPRGMEQRYLCFALFHRSYGMLKDSLEGVYWELLKAAVHACLRNEDGQARRAILSVYENLSPQQTDELLPEIHYGVLNPSPSGVGASDYIRMAGAEILSEWKVEEGIDAILFYVSNQNHWGSAKRVPVLLDYLRRYGAHAKRVIPELEKLEADFADGEEDFPRDRSKLKAEAVREAIEFLNKTEARPELRQVR